MIWLRLIVALGWWFGQDVEKPFPATCQAKQSAAFVLMLPYLQTRRLYHQLGRALSCLRMPV